MPYFLTYVSTARQLMTTDQLHGLLASCRRSNTALSVTGALLYRDGTFMQVLEGDRDVVRGLFDKIRVDARHYDVTFMYDGDRPERQFDDWSMAFRDLTADADDLANGFSQFMQTRDDETYGPEPTVAQRLLLTFRRTLAPAS